MRKLHLIAAVSVTFCMMGAAQAQSGGNPLVGAWSTQVQLNDGSYVFQTQAFNPDGSFSVTGRFPNGMLTRMWGSYQVTQTGPNQWRMDRQVVDSLPRQTCARANGGPVNCNPVTPQRGRGYDMVSFSGPNAITMGNSMLTRDLDAQLVRVSVPAQFVMDMQVPVPSWAPSIPGGGGYQPQYDPHHWDRDNDLQQERICTINGGRIEVVGGRERCIQ